MGNSKDIPPWNHARQRVYPEDQRSVPNHDSIKLAKKKREPLRDDQELPKYLRFKCER